MSISDLIRVMSDGDFHSGEVLGRHLGVSRTAVWKQLRKIEGMGLALESVRGRGYRLIDPPEPLDGAVVVAALSHQARRHLRHLFIEDRLDSTNSRILERFEQGAGHGEVCLAELQTKGRGRRGRGFYSEWGGCIHFSIGWQFENGVAALEGLSLAVGAVMAELLKREGVPIRLKWPNDLLAPGAEGVSKLGGILVEVRGDASGPCQVVIGIGINARLSPHAAEAIGQPVASLCDSRTGLSRNQLVSGMIEALMSMLQSFEREGFAPWREPWSRYHFHAGREVRISRGERCYDGVVEDIDDVGNLIVNVGEERMVFSGGEVSLRGRS
ncbi:biotin--[acetyl-CoA-carboxylase] ligase [Kushneria aurantia]|uniref:Bifunctional ligase/repressor BirA n=1 Tax=Kushneria aurantia TaxID=504092 RepID=A0ABV6G6I2_9GAMM|nr:biotin--[acetyl-CoA-carboxylase] ligase [Kushneria aurantia]